MTANVQLLRDAIGYCRRNPNSYDQNHYYDSNTGTTCVIGRAAILSGKTFRNSHIFNDDGSGVYEWACNTLGLSGDDRDYIVDYRRTLDEIEQRVNEISSRENSPVAPVVDEAILSINGVRIGTPAHLVDLIVTVARVANPDVRIVKITEEVL